MCRFRKRNNNTYDCTIKENDYQFCNNDIYDGCKKENRYQFSKSFIETGYISFEFERECRKKDYVTKKNQKRTSYVLKEKFEYDVICKVEL